MSLKNLADISQIASGIGALGAALFAWRAVSLATRQQRQREEPHLAIDFFVKGGAPLVSVENIGGGPASKVSFRLVTSQGQMAAGWLPKDGRVRPDQRVDIHLATQGSDMESAKCMVLGMDRWFRVHVWTSDGRHRSWDQRRWSRAQRTDAWAFEKLFPGADVRRYPDLDHDVSPTVSRTAENEAQRTGTSTAG